jgi:hypothetical protein
MPQAPPATGARAVAETTSVCCFVSKRNGTKWLGDSSGFATRIRSSPSGQSTVAISSLRE